MPAHAHARTATGGGRPAPVPGSGSLLGLVLFEPGMGYRGSYLLRCEQLGSCYLKRTVATVQTEPLQPFGWVRILLPLPELYK